MHPENPSAPPQLMTTREVAEVLRLTPQRVQHLVSRGVLSPIQLTPRGPFRFKAADVERLIAGKSP